MPQVAVAQTANQDAPFDSLRECLRWAYNHTQGMHKDSLAQFQARNPPGRGLGAGLDGAHTAGLILGQIGLMERIDRAILAARHLDRLTPCDCKAPCCCGHRVNVPWQSAIGELAQEAIKQLSGCVSHTRLRQGIVRRYFGSGEKLKDLAALVSCDPDTATNHNAKVVEWLKRKEHHALNEAERRMREIGMV